MMGIDGTNPTVTGPDTTFDFRKTLYKGTDINPPPNTPIGEGAFKQEAAGKSITP